MSNFTLRWSKQDPSLNTFYTDQISEIVVAQSGAVYLSYESFGTIPSGGTAIGTSNICVAKFDSSGNFQWRLFDTSLNTNRPFDSSDISGNTTTMSSIAIDSNENAYVAFSRLYSSDKTYYNLRIAKVNSSGVLQWVKEDASWNTPLYAQWWNPISANIAVDSNNDIYVAYTKTYDLSGNLIADNDPNFPVNITLLKINSSGNQIWIKQESDWNTNSYDENPVINIDISNNIYLLIKSYEGVIPGGTNYEDSFFLAKLDINGDTIWTKQDDDILPYPGEYFKNFSLKNDLQGNIYIMMSSAGYYGLGNQGASDLYFVKLDTNGAFQWRTTSDLYNTNDENYIRKSAMDVDEFGNIYFSAHTESGALPGQSSNGTSDIYYGKIDTNGNLLFVYQDTSLNTTGYDKFASIGLDKFNNMYLSYTSNGNIQGGTYIYYNVYSNIGNPNNSTDIIVVYTDTNGNKVWAKQDRDLNTSSTDDQPSVAIGNTGIYVSYRTQGAHADGVLVGVSDAVIVKLDFSGNKLWARQNTSYLSIYQEDTPVISVDSSDNVILVYTTYGVSPGGTNRNTSLGTGDARDIVICKFDQSGNFLWLKQDPSFNTFNGDRFGKITTDISQNIILVYHTTGIVQGGTAAGTGSLPGFADIAVAKLDKDGVLQWIRQQPTFNTGRDDLYPNCATDSQGNIYVINLIDFRQPAATNNALSDYRTSKFDISGNLQWTFVEGNFNQWSTDFAPSITVDYSDNIVYTVATGDAGTYGTNVGQLDMIVIKRTPTSSLIWRKVYTTMNSNLAEQNGIGASTNTYIDVDLANNIYLNYITNGTIPGGTRFASQNMVLAKLDANGNFVFAKQNYELSPIFANNACSSITKDGSRLALAYQSNGSSIPEAFGFTTIYNSDIAMTKFSQGFDVKNYIDSSGHNLIFGGYSYYSSGGNNYIKMGANYYQINSTATTYRDLELDISNNSITFDTYNGKTNSQLPGLAIIDPSVTAFDYLTPVAYFKTATDVNGKYAIYLKDASGSYYQVFVVGNSYVPVTDPSGDAQVYQNYFDSGFVESSGDAISLNCLLHGQRILTNNGFVEVEKLKEKDLIVTGDGRVVPIVKIHSSKVFAEKSNIPVRIPENYFSENYPSKSVFLSQAHSIQIIKDDKVQWFNYRDCANDESLLFDDKKPLIDYYHIELPNYYNDNIVCEGGLIVEPHGGYKVCYGKDYIFEKDSNGLLNRIVYNSEIAKEPVYKKYYGDSI